MHVTLTEQMIGIIDRQDARIAEKDAQLRECVNLVRDITALPVWKFVLFKARNWKRKKPAHPRG